MYLPLTTNGNFYHPRMRVSNNVSRISVCVCVCVCVCCVCLYVCVCVCFVCVCVCVYVCVCVCVYLYVCVCPVYISLCASVYLLRLYILSVFRLSENEFFFDIVSLFFDNFWGICFRPTPKGEEEGGSGPGQHPRGKLRGI